MGPYDNPSAGKFGPPAGSTDPQPTLTGPPTGRRILSAIVLLPILHIAVQHYGGQTWWAAVGLLTILWGESYAYRRRTLRGDSPYSSDQHVTP